MSEIEDIAKRGPIMIDNAATASQCRALVDDAVVREAITLNIVAPLLVEISERDARIAALEAEASEAGCMCRGVEIGSHMASVSLPIPSHMADYRAARVLAGLSPMISVDACLVVELRLLWARGIRTYGSCCGHNKVRGMVNVHEDDTAAMLAMGYEQWPEKDGMAVATFYPKSVRGVSASEGERRGLERAAGVLKGLAAPWLKEKGEYWNGYRGGLKDGGEEIRALIPEAPAQRELASAEANQISTTEVGLQEAPAEGWQPIETAPKDGTPILAYNTRNTGHHPVVVLWKDWNLDPDIGDEPHWADAATAGCDALYYNGGFFDYWRPLPPPPPQDREEP